MSHAWRQVDGSNKMLKKSLSGVLASLRGPTYRSVRLAASLTTALLDGLFELPVVIIPSVGYLTLHWHFMETPSFSAAC